MIVVLGPTGSGKSELSLHLAAQLPGEIVNFDSVQLYRGMTIGSAKLPLTARRDIPHHLLDIADLDQVVTAGAFARLAQPVLRDIRDRGFVPILVGGTGFYLRALLDGLSPAPSADPALRARLSSTARRRPLALHRLLRMRDPVAASRIHPNDHQKLIRAVELSQVAGLPAAEVQKATRDDLKGFVSLKIGLNPARQDLFLRLSDRARHMFEHGLVEETASLLAQGLPPQANALQSLGYRQALSVIEGRSSLEDAIRECQTRTRQYAKRQMTWFRREPDVRWFPGFGAEAAIQETVLRKAREFLSRIGRSLAAVRRA